MTFIKCAQVLNWADDVIVNIQWHIGKSSSPTHRSMRPHRMLLYVTSFYLSTYMLFSDWIPSNSGSHWKVCVCLYMCVSVCVYVWGMHEQICTLYLLLTIDLHNQAGCRNVPSPCLCFSCGVLWVSEVMGFIISAPQRKCEKATECQQILLELTWLASPQTGGQAFEIWLQLSMKQMNHK